MFADQIQVEMLQQIVAAVTTARASRPRLLNGETGEEEPEEQVRRETTPAPEPAKDASKDDSKE